MSDGLGQFSYEELEAIQKGDFSKLSTEKLEALQQVAGGLPVQEQAPMPTKPIPVSIQPPAPTQRLRSIAQGATLAGADEAEAYLRSMAGENYESALADIRSKTKAYQKEAPLESLGYEALGGLLSAGATTMATGGTAAPATIPQAAMSIAPVVRGLAATSALGGLYGGTTGFLSGEGDIYDRISRVPGGVTTGAIVAPAVKGLITGGGMLVDKVTDFARRLAGGRGAKVVETELQRLAGDTGLTTDEIIDRISRGEIMAENATLAAAVRGLYAQGGKASTTLMSSLTRRPEELRTSVLTDMQKTLAGQDGNVLQKFKLDDKQLKQLESEAYKDAFGTGGVIDSTLLKSVTDALKRSPSAVKDINDIYIAQTGKKPFFSFDKSGNINFSRTPNLEDAEVIRRGIQTSVDQAYQSGRGGVGGSLKEVELALREAIDTSSKKLGDARLQAAVRRTAKDAFDDGRKVFGKSADEVSILVDELSQKPGALSAFRAGTMDAIRNKMTTGTRTSMMANLSNENSKEGLILRTIYPGDELPGILQRINTAAQSQASKNYILGGSSTTPTLLQAARTGSNISAEEIANVMTANPVTMATSAVNILKKVAFEKNKNLTDSQRDMVAKILVSEDPDLVRRALVDQSAFALVQQKINDFARFAGKTVPYSLTGVTAGRLPGAFQQGQ
jgi:hypothetical protein